MLTDGFLRRMPKAELHIHIEGSLEPEMMFELAARNGVRLRHGSVKALREAYDFADLQSFLDLYYEGTRVLLYERDFYELTLAYLRKAAAQGVRHAEIFFDPQAHTSRGVPFETAITGIHRALLDGEGTLGVSSDLIMCFLRHLQRVAMRMGCMASWTDESLFQRPPSEDRGCHRTRNAQGPVRSHLRGRDLHPQALRRQGPKGRISGAGQGSGQTTQDRRAS